MDDDIDASFEHWSMKFHKYDFSTIPLLIKSYMNLDIVLVI
jgi:hypothetical protein